jgi:hypothetical protein
MTWIARTFFLCVPLATSSWAQDLQQALCIQDAEIGELEQRIDRAATNFVDALLRGDSSTTFSDLSEDLRRKLTRDGMVEQIHTIRQFEPKNAKVQHTYLIKVKKQPMIRVVCATNLLDPNQWVSLSATNVPEQAHVLISADTPNNRLAITIWVLPENDGWRVRGFWFNVSALADQEAAQLLEKARAQNQRKHLFNAALLYTAALQFVNRGPDFQMGITQTLHEDMSHLVAPPEIQGPPPFSWRSHEKTWKILSIGPLAVGGKLYISISHEVPHIQTDSQVEGWNKELLAYFKERFPEYSDVFAGVVVRAHEQGTNRGFGTVEELPAPQ